MGDADDFDMGTVDNLVDSRREEGGAMGIGEADARPAGLGIARSGGETRGSLDTEAYDV